ncbi:arylesterase [Altererythrobacter sp. KTW20L]|uniref:arylesterase n=1 Tax=Altererythrobacter sp. KTW20L TaxID=2942210 RepID=UPI0024BEDCCC|nr:arylesterase [Altererythrobacter sp. KTW20L]
MLAFALAACGAEAPPQESAETAETSEAAPDIAVSGPERTILAFGDSLFAGYNLAEHEGYPERLEVALRAQGINARVIDAGVSGDTTAAGRQRIGFVLDNAASPPDLAIVELGGNDLLRGIAPASTRENLGAILDELARREIPVLLMGMRAPPNLGAQFQAEFDGLYPALAEEYGVELVPFFLEAVFDQPQLILPDRIHPTAEGVQALVEATGPAVVSALPPAR